MTQLDPWDEYRKTKIPRGWAYPLSRTQIAEALEGAGAHLGSLSLGGPKLPPDSEALSVFDVIWLGDARPGYFGTVEGGRSRLMMRWIAVPVADRREVARQLNEGILRRGCEWAAEALARGNAWLASEHRFWCTYVDGGLQVSEV